MSQLVVHFNKSRFENEWKVWSINEREATVMELNYGSSYSFISVFVSLPFSFYNLSRLERLLNYIEYKLRFSHKDPLNEQRLQEMWNHNSQLNEWEKILFRDLFCREPENVETKTSTDREWHRRMLKIKVNAIKKHKEFSFVDSMHKRVVIKLEIGHFRRWFQASW